MMKWCDAGLRLSKRLRFLKTPLPQIVNYAIRGNGFLACVRVHWLQASTTKF